MSKGASDTTIAPEQRAAYAVLREAAGLLDRSSRGKLEVSGPEASDFLQGLVTNDVEALAPGTGCYAALLSHKGKMLADMRVLCDGERFLIDTEPVATQAVLGSLQRYRLGRSVEIADRSAQLGLLAVIGPRAREVIGAEVPEPEHSFTSIELEGATALAIASFHGAPAVDLMVAADGLAKVAARLTDAGAAPVPEEAAECLRIEAGRPRFGIDMDTSTIPQEAGIDERAVSFTKGCYVGQETVARLQHRGRPNRHLRGLRLTAPADAGCTLSRAGKVVGRLTSAAVSPVLGPIALAMVRRAVAPGERIGVGGGSIAAQVVELPFPRS